MSELGGGRALVAPATYARGGARDLESLRTGSPYVGYTYGYPHKTAYRPLAPPRPLPQVWRQEPRDALFLYLHVPFCEMRCGFCNLFTQTDSGQTLRARYLDALERQAAQLSRLLPDARFVRVAFGGGTPTDLPLPLFERLLAISERHLRTPLDAVPVSLETSPRTATAAHLRVATERGVDRISIGIQSFEPEELKRLGRAEPAGEGLRALERIRASGRMRLNIDLIYGIEGQSLHSWLQSLEQALAFEPEELYLYPLYVRPLTGLGKRDRRWSDHRLRCYRAARERLLSGGYAQVSMRMFERVGGPVASEREDAPVYCCQQDGMLGLGAGARSYTRGLHYSDEWAVSARGVRGIVADWVAREAGDFGLAHHGIELDADEQRRRHLLQSLLQAEGVDRALYRARFEREVHDDFPALRELIELGLAELSASHLRLTADGMERSDAIGPFFYSDAVWHQSRGFLVR